MERGFAAGLAGTFLSLVQLSHAGQCLSDKIDLFRPKKTALVVGVFCPPKGVYRDGRDLRIGAKGFFLPPTFFPLALWIIRGDPDPAVVVP
ncbi:hypothetical protein [Asaia bogorensis]|uniref:Uncharacterized protein n=1 Tax=Asaia bogorensis NBRC 16594 TaxID=1231624 RepID=A0AAN4R5M8_9PROT|nr:hypothetical protein [Asaia bogorensis]GEL54863.1 hypothetical protein ABO01nite_28700 [Asaia bogorensis NBRC 16594]